jgi:uncharacterized protein (DUF362 family)
MRRPFADFCGGTHRRNFLATAASLPMLSAVHVSASEPRSTGLVGKPGTLGLPGPYPGRVVEARNPRMIQNGTKDRQAIKETLARGMRELTGADDATGAWRSFFEPGDVVAIKMNPVGNPLANTSTELLLEVIDGLKSAGVKTGDIFVYDRYRENFMEAGMHKAVPDGIKWGGLTPENDESQLQIDWSSWRHDPIAGYDPHQFVSMNLVHHDHDPKDDRTVRSHLGKLITRTINKIVFLPMLKDHGSAGVTGALKNMSHGSVNNVARSHSTADTNACNMFIPEIVSHPIIRKKAVLQIMDGIKGVFQKGPFGQNPELIWEYNALFFATDPVAMDHVEWRTIDAKRKEKNLPPVAATGRTGLDPLGTEGFDIRQPQHIPLAANLGLGVFEFKTERTKPGQQVIDHRIVSM